MSLESLKARLDAARVEQTELKEQYRRSRGTVREESAHARLRAMTTRVARYERLMRSFEPRARRLSTPG